MEVALGIFIGVCAIETLVIAGVAFVVVTEADDSWREHKQRTTERIRAWRIVAPNNALTCSDTSCTRRQLIEVARQ